METITIDGVEYILLPKLQTEKPELLFNDWRVPTIEELFTLIDYTKCNPASFLEDTVSYYYWSSTVLNGTFVVDFEVGHIDRFTHSGNHYIRFVRDSEHGLQWSKTYSKRTSQEAIEFAKTLVAPIYYKGEIK